MRIRKEEGAIGEPAKSTLYILLRLNMNFLLLVLRITNVRFKVRPLIYTRITHRVLAELGAVLQEEIVGNVIPCMIRYFFLCYMFLIK